MAGSNRIDFTIGFNIDKTGFTQLNESFNKVTALSQMPGATKQLKEAGVMAQQVGTILRESFNYDFGQINIGKFTQGLNQAGISMQQLRTGFYSAGSVGQNTFATLGSSILNTKIQIKESNTLLDQMATTMANTVKWGIASGVFNTITQSVREAYAYVKKLDKSLNDIRIVTNKSADSMKDFSAEANKAAKSLGKSTRDYTEASLLYYQQGLKDDEVKARTETTLKTANVTGQSTSTTSEELTAVWNGYKVQAQDTEKYVDKLAAVAADSASDLEELSTAMSKVASSANAMGVDVDSLNAQISTIISTTRQAPETIGTALKTIYARMGDLEADGTDEFGVSLGDITSQMQSMGVSILDETGSMRDMGDVIEEVGQKWQGWTREQKQAAAIAMAGKRQYNNLFALFENWNQYNKELEVSKDSLGTLQQQQNTYMESMAAKQQRLSTQTEAFYSALIGDGQEVNNLVDGLTELMTVVTQFTNGMGGGFKSMIGYMTIIANLFKNQIGKGLLKHFENKRLDDYNQSVIQGKKETYLAGQNLKNINGTPEFSNGKWQATDTNGNTQQLTANQAGNISAFEKEAAIAKEIDSIRKSLTEEEYNSLVAQQQEVGILEKKLAILKEQQAISKKESNTLFAFQQGDAYQEYQNAKNTPGANVELAGDTFLKKQKERLEAANRLKNEGNKLTEKRIQKLKVEAGYSKDSKATAEVIVNRSKERLELAKEIVKQDKQEAEWKEQQANTENRVKQNVNNRKEDQEKTQNIQGMIGAASSLAMTLGGVNSILDTVFNKDISGGEKILQIFTQLAFILPMLYSAYTSLNAIQAISIGQTTIGATAQEFLNAAILKFIPSAKGAAIAQTALNTAMNTNVIVAVVTAILTLVTAYSILTRRASEARQAKIETNNKIIEGNQALKDEKDAISENAKAYNEAYNKYKETGEGKSELVTASQNLIDKLGDEGTALLSVIDNYSLFNDKLKEVLATRLQIKNTDATNLIKSYEAAGRNVSLQNQEDASEDKAGFWSQTGAELAGFVSTLGFTGLEDLATLITGDAYHAASAEGEHTYGMTFTSQEESDAVSIIEDTLSDYGSAIQTNWDKWAQIVDHGRASDFVMNFENLNAEESVVAMQALEKALKDLEKDGKQTTETYSSLSAQYQQLDEAIQAYREQLETLSEYYSASVFATNTTDADDEMNNRKDYEAYKTNMINAYKDNDYIKKAAEVSGDAKAYYEDRFKSDIYAYGSTDIQAQYEAEQNRESQRMAMGNAVKKTYGVEDYGWNEAQKQDEDFQKLIKHRKNTNKDIVNALDDTNLMSYVDLSVFNQEDWEKIYNADSANKAAEYIIDSSMDTIRKTFEKGIDDVVSGGKDAMSQALSGDLTPDNISDEFKSYQKQLESASEIYPKLENEINIVNNTALIGTQAWYDALDEVQDKMENIQISQANTTAYDNLEEVLLKYRQEDFSVNIDANTQEFTDKMDDLLNDSYSVSVKIRAEGHQDFTSLTGQLDNIDEAVEKIGEDYIVAADDVTAIGEAIPGVLQQMQYMSDGTVKLNKEAIQSSVDAARQSIKTKVEETATKLETEAEYHSAQATLYGSMAEIAQQAANNEIGIEDAKNKLLAKAIDVQANNNKMLKETEITNQKKLADSSQENGGILASNWAEAYQSAALNSAEFAAVAKANNEAATGDGKIETKNIVPHYEGAEGSTTTVSEIPDIEKATKEDLGDLAQKYKAKAESEQQAANTAFSEAQGIRAKLNASNVAASNVKKGKGASGDKDKDKDSTDLEPITDEFDLLENINNQLEIQENHYDRINTLIEHTYGLTKIQGIKEENKILDAQLKLYKQKDKLIQKDINRQGSKLIHYGANFGEDGTVSNHQQVWEKLKAKVNKAAASGKEKTYEKAKQEFEDYEDAYGKYNEALQEAGDNLAKQQELIYQKVENNVKAIEAEVTVRVDTGEAIRNLQEFKESMASDSDYFTKLQTNIAKGLSYTQSKEMQTYIKNAEKAKKAYNKIVKGGKDKTYGTDSQAAMDAYKNYTDKAAESAKSIQEAIKNYYSTMKEWMSSLKSDFDDVQNKLKNITDETKYYADLLNLIHGSNKAEQAQLATQQGNEHAEQTKYYYKEQDKWDKIEDNYQKRINKKQKERDKLEDKVKNAKTKKAKKQAKQELQTTKNSIEELENLRDEAIKNSEIAQNNAQQASLNSLKAYQDAFKYSIEAAFQDFENEMTDGKGFDWANKLWSLDKDYINNWYDNIEKDLNLKDFTLSIDMDIDEASSDAIKEKLAQFRDEQEKQLKNQAYLSEYDFKLAKAKYNVLKKQIALQEAQDKKTSLRLRRNSQGNYTYQYTANNNDINKARSELNDANNEWYKITKDQRMSTYEKSASLISSLVTDLKAKAESEGLENIDTLSQQEIETWMQDHVGDYYTNWKTEYDAAYNDYLQAQNDYAEAAYTIAMVQSGKTDKVWQQLSDDEKQRWIKDTLPKLGSAFKEYYTGVTQDSQHMEEAVTEVWRNCNNAMVAYKNGFEKLKNEANVQIPAVNTIINTHKDKVKGVKKQWGKVLENYEAYEKAINDDKRISALEKSLNAVKQPIINLYNSLDTATEKAGNLKNAIDALKGKTITVTTRYVTSGNPSGGGGGGNNPGKASPTKIKKTKNHLPKTKASVNNQIEKGDKVSWTNNGIHSDGKKHVEFDLWNTKKEAIGDRSKNAKSIVKVHKANEGYTENVLHSKVKVLKYDEKSGAVKIQFSVLPFAGDTHGAGNVQPFEYSGWISAKTFYNRFSGFDTGGYTGDWNSSEGKIAMLHEKELVLNKEDTANMLKIVDSVREINAQNLDLSSLIAQQIIDTLYSNMQSIKKDFALQSQLSMKQGASNDELTIDQNVTINADFPGVSNAKEIEKAFNSLENMATQKAYSTKRR